MSTDPSNAAPPPPPPAPAPPATPGPGASRDEWRAWRHANRDYLRARWGGWGWAGTWSWGLFWPVALIVLGGYLLLSNLGLLSWLRGDIFWPIVFILVGVFLLLRRGRW